jgi:hypothetical protein
LPEVDSSVIPALLQEFDRNTDSFDKLDGDASVAWLDDNDRLTLKVARISYSPLVIAMLADGSFAFASTEPMLLSALRSARLEPIYLETISERTLLTIENGSLVNVETLPDTDPKYVEKFSGGYGGWRSMTSGGHSKPTQSYNDTFLPNDYYGEDLAGYYYNESMPDILNEAPIGDLYEPEYYGYPRVVDYWCNQYGEYFDEYGSFMGSVDDFAQMGYLSNAQLDEFTKSWWTIHQAKN